MVSSMKSILSNGISIAYYAHGPEDGEVVLFIQGVGGTVSPEPDALTQILIARGYRVILFDNRDAGGSRHFDEAGVPDVAAIAAAAAGKAGALAYTLDDMAEDVVGLLDTLNIARAHLVGGSSGGMIAQVVAAEYPARAASLTLISTTTGNPALVGGEAPVDAGAMSPATARQAAAAAAAGDLRQRSARIQAPTVVVHGERDRVFPPDHGEDLAATIPGAELRLVWDMGHEPDSQHLQAIAEAINVAAMRQRSSGSRPQLG
jgi:pimeloyl-ACP methyl ester carboxylesterase